LDLAVVLILATLLTAFTFILPDGNILRIVFGLPFLLFLPGYSFVSALWTKKTELGGLERVALSLGLSIAIVALVGLGLNYTPWGIALTSVVSTLFILIILLVVITRIRRSRLEPRERFTLRFDFLIEFGKTMSSSDKLFVLITVIAIVIGMSFLFYIATNPPKEQYTALFIHDENGTTNDYPTSLEINESASIIITVACHEQQVTDYDTVIRLLPESGLNRTLIEYNFLLLDDEEWRQEFNFSINESGKFKLEVELFKDGGTMPYATNHLWIDVEE
jgi:uncharacterized membrane protein